MSGIRVRYVHEGRWVEMCLLETESTEKLRDKVEEELPLGLSVSSLTFQGELLPSTVRLCDVEPSALVRVKTKDQRPQRHVIMWNGSKPFLVECFCRGHFRRVKVFQNSSEFERYEWDGYEHSEDHPLDADHDGDADDADGFSQTEIANRKRRRWHMDSQDEDLDLDDLGYGTRRGDFDSYPLHDLEVDDIFIGRSELETVSLHSSGYGSLFDGNSILLKQSDQYIFLGQKIWAFSSQHEILKFASPVGNSCVPYTYAVDDHGRYFLFAEKVILEKVPKSEDTIGHLMFGAKCKGRPCFGLDVCDFEPYSYLYQDFAYDKCKFKLRYCGNMITYRHPKMMPHLHPMRDDQLRYEKLVNGKVQRVSCEEFEKLLTKWFKAHGISHMECHEIQFNGERKC